MFPGDMPPQGFNWGNQPPMQVPPLFQGHPGYVNYHGSYPKPTPANVEAELSQRLCVPIHALRFIRVSELTVTKPLNHACFSQGVSQLQVRAFRWFDGTEILYGVCPSFPNCNVVYYSTDGDYCPHSFGL